MGLWSQLWCLVTFLVTTSTQPSLLDLQLAVFWMGSSAVYIITGSFGSNLRTSLGCCDFTVPTTWRQKIQITSWELSPTISSIDHGTKESRYAATVNGFINEFVGSFVLFFAALGLTKLHFGAELKAVAESTVQQQVQQATLAGQKSQNQMLKMLSTIFLHNRQMVLQLLHTWHLVSW